jgi:hypothetical protein
MLGTAAGSGFICMFDMATMLSGLEQRVEKGRSEIAAYERSPGRKSEVGLEADVGICSSWIATSVDERRQRA